MSLLWKWFKNYVPVIFEPQETTFLANLFNSQSAASMPLDKAKLCRILKEQSLAASSARVMLVRKLF